MIESVLACLKSSRYRCTNGSTFCARRSNICHLSCFFQLSGSGGGQESPLLIGVVLNDTFRLARGLFGLNGFGPSDVTGRSVLNVDKGGLRGMLKVDIV